MSEMFQLKLYRELWGTRYCIRNHPPGRFPESWTEEHVSIKERKRHHKHLFQSLISLQGNLFLPLGLFTDKLNTWSSMVKTTRSLWMFPLPESSRDKQLSKELHLPTTTHKCKSSAVDGFIFVSSLLHLKSLMNNLSPPSNNMSTEILNMQHESFTYSSRQSFQSEEWMSVPISANTTGGLETSAEPFAATATQNSSWIWNWSVIHWESQP